MRKLTFGTIVSSFVASLMLVATPGVAHAKSFKLDPGHSQVLFRAKHVDVAYVYGQFLDVSGTLEYDADKPEKASINWSVKTGSVFTGVKKRDKHLKSSDFLNAKQFPTIEFESTKVKKKGDGEFEVTGKLSLHGETKEITVPVEKTGSGKGPKGNYRVGFHSEFTIDRTEYGIDHMAGPVSKELKIIVTAEGMEKGGGGKE